MSLSCLPIGELDLFNRRWKALEAMAAISEIDKDTLNEADALYLAEVSGRIATKTAGLL